MYRKKMIIIKRINSDACPSCGCDPCDCDWGITVCERCGSDDCWCHWGDE